MPNITISIDEKLLKIGREYAEEHHTSVNALIRNLLEQTVRRIQPSGSMSALR